MCPDPAAGSPSQFLRRRDAQARSPAPAARCSRASAPCEPGRFSNTAGPASSPPGSAIQCRNSCRGGGISSAAILRPCFRLAKTSFLLGDIELVKPADHLHVRTASGVSASRPAGSSSRKQVIGQQQLGGVGDRAEHERHRLVELVARLRAATRYASPWDRSNAATAADGAAPRSHEPRQVIVDDPLFGLLQDAELGEAGLAGDTTPRGCSGSRPLKRSAQKRLNQVYGPLHHRLARRLSDLRHLPRKCPPGRAARAVGGQHGQPGRYLLLQRVRPLAACANFQCLVHDGLFSVADFMSHFRRGGVR